MDGKTKDALKQLQAEIRQLQTAMASIKPGSVGETFDHGDGDAVGGRGCLGKASRHAGCSEQGHAFPFGS